MKWSGQCTHPSWRPTNMQIYAHQKVKVLEVTIKTRKTPEWSTYFCAKKSMQASEAMWSVGKETAAKERGRSRRCPPLLGWSAVGCPGGGTRLSRTDYGLRPFLMVAQKGRKHLQQNCPSSRSRREGPLMTAPLHAIHDITKRLGSLSALPPSSNWLG